MYQIQEVGPEVTVSPCNDGISEFPYLRRPRLQCCSRTSGAFLSRVKDWGPLRHSSHCRRYADTVEEAELPKAGEEKGMTGSIVWLCFPSPSLAGFAGNIKPHHHNATALPESQVHLLLDLK